MFDTARYDEHFARRKIDRTIAKLHSKVAAMDEKELVLPLVKMPNKWALHLDDLYVLSVELANDPRFPLIVDRVELLRERHLFDRRLAMRLVHL